VIFLSDLFDAASQRHNDVILLPAIRQVSGNEFVFQQDSQTVHQHTTPCTVQQLNLLQRLETPNFLAPNLRPPNSPDLCPVDYEIWAVMQHRVDHRQIHSVDKLKRRLIDVWRSPDGRLLTKLLTSGEEDIKHVSMLKDDTLSTACELTMLILSISVTLNVTCLTFTFFLITKSC